MLTILNIRISQLFGQVYICYLEDLKNLIKVSNNILITTNIFSSNIWNSIKIKQILMAYLFEKFGIDCCWYTEIIRLTVSNLQTQDFNRIRRVNFYVICIWVNPSQYVCQNSRNFYDNNQILMNKWNY